MHICVFVDTLKKKPPLMNLLFFRLCLIYSFLFTGTTFLSAQEHFVQLNWGAPKLIDTQPTSVQKAMWFEDAEYRNSPVIPEYIIRMGVTDPYLDFIASVDDDVYAPLTSEEQLILEQSGYEPESEISAVIRHQVIRKQRFSELFVIPVRKNPGNGVVEKLMSCRINVEFFFSTNESNQKTVKNLKTTQSVLSEGTFHKISVTQPGIYRLTQQNLAEMGINVTTTDPRNIRIFGNGGQMLPEKNDIPRVDDLYENAIYVHGENDGSFDAGDYVLFYAPGPHSWSFDTTNNEYQYSVNRYNDKSFYFLTVNKGQGKRIQTVNHLSETPSHTNSIFLDKSVYENETYNHIKSGKEWYGDVFDLNLNQSFAFSTPNALSDSCIKVRVNMIARASGPTSANINIGSAGQNIGFQGTTGYNSDFAKSATGVMCVNPSSSINVSITYNKNNYNDAKAWLDRITVNAWRNLSMTGNQMHFQNPLISMPGNFVRHNLTSTLPLTTWDITDALDPVIVQGNQNGSAYYIIDFASEGKKYIAHTGLSYLSPVFEGTVANQNLHGLSQVDYIIVSHPLFLEQANKLGQFHNQLNGLSYTVVTPSKIYNEFSSGSQDPSAIRDFVKMFYDRATGPNDMPKYLLFFGRASYDYKNRISENTNLVPTFQSLESLSPTKSYASDDFFGLLDDGEGHDCTGHLDIGIGRLPSVTVQEADDLINKIFRYHEKTNFMNFQNTCDFIQNIPNLSDWRNWVTFISDDGDNNLHFNQSENLSTTLIANYKHLNIDKIHLDAFPQVSTPGGERAPVVNETINRRMYLGCLIMNYTGHGGEVGWAHERMLELSDINSWENYYNMPLFITATCEFSRFDDPKRIAAGEMVLTNPKGGGIALFSTTRLAYSSFNENLNRSVYKVAFEHNNGIYPTLGEILSFAKIDNGSNEFIRNFILLGDPAMRLAYPEHRVVTTAINGNPVGITPDTISAYSFVTIEGQINDIDDNKLTGFNGVITPTVFDKPSTLSTLATDPSSTYPSTFKLQKNIIYKGKVNVVDGAFSFSFFVPKDINYAFDFGKISYYAENGQTDATGYFNDFYVGGSDANNSGDNTGPVIELFMNDTTFVNGGTTNENPVLIAQLFDQSGINTMGSGIGHDLVSIMDNSGEVIVMNDYYEADLDSYQSGRVIYPFFDLDEGIHSVYFKAWDVFNNSSEAVLTFYVSVSHDAVIRKMLNYPNPFNEYTDFIFEHNQSCTPYSITIDIFTMLGQHVASVRSEHESLGYTSEPIRWHGLSHDGNPLSSGVYVYTVSLTTCEGSIAQKSSRLVIVK
jgi:hypothetical protein